MTTLEHILEYYKVKTHFIIYKHSVITPKDHFYSHAGTASVSGNLGLKIKEVEDELSNETVGILLKYQHEANVDFDGLMEGLHFYKDQAKQTFINMHKY